MGEGRKEGVKFSWLQFPLVRVGTKYVYSSSYLQYIQFVKYINSTCDTNYVYIHCPLLLA